MTGIDPRIASLAHAYGISTEFWDWKGQYRQPSEATVVACLKAMDVDTEGEEWIDKAFIEADERPWRKALPECIVVTQDEAKKIHAHVRSGRPAHVWVRLEDGSTFALDQVGNFDPDRIIDSKWVGRASFNLPTHVPPGYHTLFLESDDDAWESSFVVTPKRLPTPEIESDSVWGFMTQLYSVCSETSWGVGDFTDLADLAVWAKTAHGADFVLINPIHAAEVTAPMQPSPYFPSTRQYVNPIYIRPEGIEEYATALQDARALVQQRRKEAYLAAETSSSIPRDEVWVAKKDALKVIFQLGRRASREMAFEAFVASEGEMLRLYATWCVL
ncbi:MAG: 4-alpha-glucanotransferase, partial [Propionibacteriaceae bacterium]|nr:4-alpha-glucanotransferase [Propionibacteriaceae bacterium]